VTYDDYGKFTKYLGNLSIDEFDWFVTLEMPWAARESDADGVFDGWISALETDDGISRWARIAERGDGDSLKLHVLIGGRESKLRYKWMCLWRERTGGDAYSRRLDDTKKLRGLFEYLVDRRGCGFSSKDTWGSRISFRGMYE
jgi:hypothetical protein